MQLFEDDPVYLMPWANSFEFMKLELHKLIDEFHDEDGRQVLPWERYSNLEKGALYYAGLIFQSNEPCHQRYKREDSCGIIWHAIQEDPRLPAVLKEYVALRLRS